MAREEADIELARGCRKRIGGQVNSNASRSQLRDAAPRNLRMRVLNGNHDSGYSS
jgi:hypothetical protein